MSAATHVIIVAYGNPEQLDGCLLALSNAAPVAVVDNSSSSAVRDVAAKYGAHYADARGNAGFAAGVNLALRRLEASPPDYVLLLNPDARLSPRQLRLLEQQLGDRCLSRVAAISPRLVGHDGAPQRVVWPFPSPLRAWLQAMGLGHLRSRQTFVIGAVLLLRWVAVHEVGLFDERFFLYAEETDWLRRAQLRGWRSSICVDVVVEHQGAGSSDNEERREALFHAGQETYIRKWYGTVGWSVYRVAVAVGSAARATMLRGPRRAQAAHRAALYVRGPRRAAGLDT